MFLKKLVAVNVSEKSAALNFPKKISSIKYFWKNQEQLMFLKKSRALNVAQKIKCIKCFSKNQEQ